jgi:formylglycine-generating enzyme required for sulfatase activity
VLSVSVPLVVVSLVSSLFGSPPVGTAASCPTGTRLVEGEHREKITFTCTEVKWGYCAAFARGVAQLEGATNHVSVCMDEFEAPNRRGAKPILMVTATQAIAWCARENKRLCTEYEWETACEGPEHLPYGYGWASDGETCNTGRPWRAFSAEILLNGTPAQSQRELDRLWQGDLSGARASCVTRYGVHDMVGNAEEWVTASRHRKDRPQVLAGGHWAKPWSHCRDINFAHEPFFKFYEVGFRCCADPK